MADDGPGPSPRSIRTRAHDQALLATVLDDGLYPNSNWDPRIREGTLTLTNFTHMLTFEGFAGAFIRITGS